MQAFQGIAELEKAVGAHLGYCNWHIVTQQQITLSPTPPVTTSGSTSTRSAPRPGRSAAPSRTAS